MAEYNGEVEISNKISQGLPEDIEALNNTIEYSQKLADFLNVCSKCGGMVVDLSSGKLYCRLTPPLEVLESNLKIRLN